MAAHFFLTDSEEEILYSEGSEAVAQLPRAVGTPLLGVPQVLDGVLGKPGEWEVSLPMVWT